MGAGLWEALGVGYNKAGSAAGFKLTDCRLKGAQRGQGNP